MFVWFWGEGLTSQWWAQVSVLNELDNLLLVVQFVCLAVSVPPPVKTAGLGAARVVFCLVVKFVK